MAQHSGLVLGVVMLSLTPIVAVGSTDITYHWGTQQSTRSVWGSQFLGVWHSFGKNAISTRVTNEARYGKDAQLLNIGGEAALLGSEYTIHLAKGWGGGWLPRSMYSLQGRTPVSRTWITHYKIDYSQYSSDKLAFMTLGVSHYWGNFRGLLDLGEYHILSSTPQVSPTWYSGFEGTLSYYFNDCSLSLALGRSLAPGTSPSYSPEKTNSAAIWVVYDLTNHWKLIPDINYYMQQGGPPYFGGGLSLQYSFRK